MAENEGGAKHVFISVWHKTIWKSHKTTQEKT